MQKIIAVMLVSILATAIIAQVAVAKAKGGPTPAQIEKAGDKAVYDKDNIATHKLPGTQGEVRFIPAKIGDIKDAELAKGAIIGKLDTPHKTADGLEAGMYQAFLCKEGGKWTVYYCQKGEVVAKAGSTEVGTDNSHKPVFVERGHSIRYWFLKFSL